MLLPFPLRRDGPSRQNSGRTPEVSQHNGRSQPPGGPFPLGGRRIASCLAGDTATWEPGVSRGARNPPTLGRPPSLRRGEWADHLQTALGLAMEHPAAGKGQADAIRLKLAGLHYIVGER